MTNVHEQIDYARRIVEHYEAALPRGTTFRGARVLELGPGPTLATALLLSARGADVTAADPYLPPWDDAVHGRLCEELIRQLSSDPTAQTWRLARAVECRSFEPAVRCVAAGAESLDPIPDASFDVVLSNAVFEHVEHVPRALFQLARVTTPGGIGIHQIDFRDHRDFTRPLEYLTIAADVFWSESARDRCERGNRWRHTHMLAAAAASGFTIERFDCHQRADAAYVSSLARRLHRDFAALRPPVLSVLVGRIVCRRTMAAAARPPITSRGLLPSANRRLLPRTTSRRIVVYGAGAGGVEALDRLRALGLDDAVVAVCDSNPQQHGRSVGGHVVRALDAIDPSSYTSVIIGSVEGRVAITQLLADRGLIEDPELRPLGFIGALMTTPAGLRGEPGAADRRMHREAA